MTLISRRQVLGGLAALGVSSAVPAAAADRLGTSRVLGLGTSGGVLLGLKSYPRTLALDAGEVVLSFDDGPAASTAHVLDVLQAENVRATFFLIGRHAQAMPGLVRRMVAESHTVGCHSFSHPWTMRQLSEAAGKDEILKGFAAIDQAAYGETRDRPLTPFFRYPGFADTDALNRWMMARDIGIFGTDLWASDWNAMSPEAELSLLMSRLDKLGRGLILLHDPRPQTVAMLPAFLAALRRRGYRLVHVEAAAGTAQTMPAPAIWKSETERMIAIAAGHRPGHAL